LRVDSVSFRAVGGKSTIGLALCAVAIAAVAVFAGCGGGGDSSSGSTAGGGGTTSAANGGSGKSESGSGGGGESTGKSEAAGKSAPGGEFSDSGFVKQANAICEESKKQSLGKMSAYVKKHKGGSQKANIEVLKEAIEAVIVPAIQTQAEEIRALSVSGDDEAKVDAFATALEEGVGNAEEAKGSSTAPFAKSFKDSAELAHEYGLDGCAYG
jgi:hypothetical protein